MFQSTDIISEDRIYKVELHTGEEYTIVVTHIDSSSQAAVVNVGGILLEDGRPIWFLFREIKALKVMPTNEAFSFLTGKKFQFAFKRLPLDWGTPMGLRLPEELREEINEEMFNCLKGACGGARPRLIPNSSRSVNISKRLQYENRKS